MNAYEQARREWADAHRSATTFLCEQEDTSGAPGGAWEKAHSLFYWTGNMLNRLHAHPQSMKIYSAGTSEGVEHMARAYSSYAVQVQSWSEELAALAEQAPELAPLLPLMEKASALAALYPGRIAACAAELKVAI